MLRAADTLGSGCPGALLPRRTLGTLLQVRGESQEPVNEKELANHHKFLDNPLLILSNACCLAGAGGEPGACEGEGAAQEHAGGQELQPHLG